MNVHVEGEERSIVKLPESRQNASSPVASHILSLLNGNDIELVS